ncbi:hypothetical protein [Agromyces humi]|uniref:hypothetical protein n=1 Tax=Agromyces humi TaxID=1766800 RepID=UPI001356D754|nr:hypothetical protein [Agromyces humi]
MSLYSLTHLTGRKRNVDRKIIVMTVEANKATFIVTVISVAVSIVPTAILYIFIGAMAMVIMPTLFGIAGWWLFRYRSQKGLQLPMYKLLLDRGRAKQLKGKALVCGVPMPAESAITQIVPSSVSVDDPRHPTAWVRDENDPHEFAPVHGRANTTTKATGRTDILD